jgi:putative component of membrane protein insertase Oxa1/YidC/SpoIIIJ protein YidD
MNIRLVLLFLVYTHFCAYGQNKVVVNLSQQIITHQVENLKETKRPKRKFINLSEVSVFQKINPLTYVGAGLLFFYQRVISEQISADCTYQVSCSEATKLAIEKHGLIAGSLIGVHQLSTCVPGNHKEHAAHKVNEKGKIINDL